MTTHQTQTGDIFLFFTENEIDIYLEKTRMKCQILFSVKSK